MLAAALRLALAALIRHPRELTLANAAWILLLILPLITWPLFPPGFWRFALILVALAWSFAVSSALCAAVARIVDGRSAFELRAWFRLRWFERLAALGLGLAGVLASLGGLHLYAGLPRPAALILSGILVLAALWLALALLISLGLASDEKAPWRSLWRAAVLLPLAFPVSVLGLGLLGIGFSGLPVLFFGLGHWSAPLLLSPLILSPLITGAFFALVLVLLVRRLLGQAQGQTLPPVPSWRELWNPWR